jgi:putative endonuclease
MYYVYLLKNKYGNLYLGCTSNLKNRLELHNGGKVQSTKSGCPWQCIYCEVFISKKDAFDRESKLKYHAQGLRRLKERLKDTLKKS